MPQTKLVLVMPVVRSHFTFTVRACMACQCSPVSYVDNHHSYDTLTSAVANMGLDLYLYSDKVLLACETSMLDFHSQYI